MPEYDYDTLNGLFVEKAHILASRRIDDSPLKRQMIEVRDRYETGISGVVIPSPDVAGEPMIPKATPALIAEAIDFTAMRAASVMPSILVPAKDASKQSGPSSREYAGRRRRAYHAVWHESRVKLLLRRAFRHLAGYGQFALLVVPDFDKGLPQIQLRDPLTSYPSPMSPEEMRPPDDVGFIYGRSSNWIAQRLPRLADIVGQQPDVLWDVAEWIDDEWIMLGVLGPRDTGSHQSRRDRTSAPNDVTALGRAWPNRAGMVPGVIPGRVTLNRIASQVSNVMGISDLMDRIMTLEVIAQERAVFPDKYVVSAGDQEAYLVDREWHDGRTGKVNLVANAQSLGELRSDPSPLAQQLVANLERNFRMGGSGLVPQAGGESFGSLRTGRANDSILAASVDPRIQEIHEIAEFGLCIVNEAIAACFNGYWPNKKYTLFSGWAGDESYVEFRPSTHLEGVHETVVEYPIPGADAATTNLLLIQAVNGGMMSSITARSLHPLIKDAVGEERNIQVDQLRKAMFAGFLNRSQTGEMNDLDMAALIQRIVAGDPIEEAVPAVNEEAQRRQAAIPAESTVLPAPQAQPGLAQPGMGVEAQGAPAGPGGPPDRAAFLQALAQRLREAPPAEVA